MTHTLMQFIDNSTGKLHNYYPDSNPSTYKGISIQAIFKVKQKYKTRIFNFKFFGNEYLIKIISKIK